MIGTSRIYLGAHYPSDIIGGSLLVDFGSRLLFGFSKDIKRSGLKESLYRFNDTGMSILL